MSEGRRLSGMADYAVHDGEVAYLTTVDDVAVIVLGSGEVLATVNGDQWDSTPAMPGRLTVTADGLVLEEIRDLVEALRLSAWAEKIESDEYKGIIRRGLLECGVLPNSSAA